MQLRKPTQNDCGETHVPSLLEMYGAYLLANDDHRFHSGVSHRQNGHWLSSQLENFTNGWKAFETLTGV